MTPEEYAALDGTGLADLISKRQVSISEVTRAARGAIDRVNPALNAIIEIYDDRFETPELDLASGPLKGVPFLVKDIGDHFGGRKMELTPSEYVARHCHFSIIRDPVALEMTELLPMDNIMWGTDFPHSVGSFPESQKFLDEAFAGKDELRRQITLENPAKYFGLDLSKPITETPKAS